MPVGARVRDRWVVIVTCRLFGACADEHDKRVLGEALSELHSGRTVLGRRLAEL